MIIHNFICDGCGWTTTDTSTRDIHICVKCGKDMRWDLGSNHRSMGDYEHISESLAVSPSQIREHKERFPNVDVLSDGRIRFTSVRQQSKYLEKTGFRKVPQKLKKLGRKRICP